MSVGLLSLIVIALAVVGYLAGRQLAVSKVAGDIRRLHSLPSYYGQTVLLFAAVPALRRQPDLPENFDAKVIA